MLKNEFIEDLISIVANSKNIFSNDLPAIRMLFNDTKDKCHKEGVITDFQVQEWVLTDRELNKLVRVSK